MIPDNPILSSEDVEYGEDAKKEIWKHRAEHLAQAVEQQNDGERIQLLLFRLGREVYGLEIRYVNDIRLLDQITLVPRMPDWIAGVVANRGRILTVLDLRSFFKLAAAPAPENQPQAERFQICVETPHMEVALLVDEVLSVETIPLNLIRNQPDLWGEMRPGYIRGIAGYSGPQADSIVVLDLPALLADESLIIEEKII